MVARHLVILLLALAVPVKAGEPRDQTRSSAPTVRRSVSEVTIQQRLIVRIPRLPAGRMTTSAAPTASLPPIRWVEKKTDRCVKVQNLAAAAIANANSVDLLLNGGKRLRARFDKDCRTLDFYSGFYLRMHRDGRMCADRDSIRSRSGGECRIDSFRALVPAR